MGRGVRNGWDWVKMLNTGRKGGNREEKGLHCTISVLDWAKSMNWAK